MSTVGEAVRVARVAAGMTQEDLAARVAVTQATLSRFEHGDRSPSGADLNRIAAELHVSTAFLADTDAARAPLAVEAHMRRRASAPPPQWKKAEAQLNLLRAQVTALVGSLDLQPTSYLPAVDPEAVGPEEAARLVRDQWHMPIGPVHHLSRWMESSGIVIVETSLGTHRIDGLSQRIGECPVVLLNSSAPTDRKRWTLTHELGHLVMHGEYASLDAETEANAFAAEFLMPEAAIRPYLRTVTLSRLFDLKLEWMVSAQALLERAHSLTLVTRAERARLYKDLARKGWRVNEPFSDDLTRDTPEFLGHILSSFEAAGMDDTEIARRSLIDADNPISVLNFRRERGIRLVSSR